MLHRHWLGRGKRPEHGVRCAEEKAAGECRGKSGEVGIEKRLALAHAFVLRGVAILGVVGFAEHHVVAGGAGDAVAGQRAVVRRARFRVGTSERDGVDARAGKLLAASRRRKSIDRKLALPADAMAAQAGVLQPCRGVGMKALGLARELGVEDRVAPAQSHRRAPPRRVRRDVPQLAVGPGLGHVELQARCRAHRDIRCTGPT